MRYALVLGTFLLFGFPACAQQARQSQKAPGPTQTLVLPPNADDWHAYAGPIPSDPSQWHLYLGPIPSNPSDWHVYAGPIPSWPNRHELKLGWHAYAVQMQPCAIFQPAGKKYRYFDGTLPPGVKRKRRFTDADLQQIKQKGGNFRIANPGSSKSDMENALDACYESSSKLLP
jgi:hypothetical protein